jgi:hypothetical protein
MTAADTTRLSEIRERQKCYDTLIEADDVALAFADCDIGFLLDLVSRQEREIQGLLKDVRRYLQIGYEAATPQGVTT